MTADVLQTLQFHPEADAETLPGATSTRERFDDFELLRELGRGGMGVVFKARQVSLDRVVALKMLLSGQFAAATDVQRFRTEATAAARLRHPNIVAVYAVGEAGGQHYYAMEFVEGRPLDQVLRAGPMPPAKAVDYLLPLAEAIDYAHRQGVVHRDLKPSNVLLDTDDRPRIADFGLAKLSPTACSPGAVAAVTHTGAILGTPAYMAPEQASGRGPIGPAVDVYALGAVLYECLTGRTPFRAADVWDTLYQVIHADPVPPRLLNPAVPPELDAICLKCLEKDPARRYASAAELADDLRRVRDHEPVLAPTGTNRLVRFLLRESRHTEVMERWGRALMAQAGIFLIFSLVAGILRWQGVESYRPYLVNGVCALLMTGGSVWHFRFRGGLPFTALERQVSQVWAMLAMTIGLTILFNWQMGFEPYRLAPLVMLQVALALGATAAALGGTFYWGAGLILAGAVILALWPGVGPPIFGVLIGLGLFIPGWRYGLRRA